MRRFLRILIGAVMVIVLAFLLFELWPNDFPEYEYLETSLPEVDPSNVPLRVAYVVNPRFERMSAVQLEILLNSVKKESKRLLGVQLNIDTVDEISIKEVFDSIPKPISKIADSQNFDVSHYHPGDPERFRDSIYWILSETPGLANEWRKFGGKYLAVERTPKTLETLTDAVNKTLLFQLHRLYQVLAKDGYSVIGKSDYHKWTMWVGIGYSGLPYDIFLTNQVIASPTFWNVEIHSAIRGAMPVGTAAYSESGRYNGFAFFSTFPFQNDSQQLKNLRGNESYSKVEQARFAGTYLVHEIGHLLFRYGHPFDIKGCVMNPATLLLLRDWFHSLDSKSCFEGEEKAIKEGEAMFHRIELKEDA